MPTLSDKPTPGQSPGQPPYCRELPGDLKPLEQYAALLRIRRAAVKRTAIGLASLFVVAAGAALVLATPAQGSERETILGVLLVTTLVSALLSYAWNHAILTNMLDLIEVLKRQLQDRK